MMTKATISKSPLLITLSLGLALAFTSCTTSYDSYGRQTQSVDPGLAVAGAAAAGILGYAIANDRKNTQRRNDHYRNQHQAYHPHRGHHGHHGGYHHPQHGRRYYR